MQYIDTLIQYIDEIYDKTYIRRGKMGHRNYSVSLCWYSTPLRVVKYHKLDWIILDVRFYLVEYLFNVH